MKRKKTRRKEKKSIKITRRIGGRRRKRKGPRDVMALFLKAFLGKRRMGVQAKLELGFGNYCQGRGTKGVGKREE